MMSSRRLAPLLLLSLVLLLPACASSERTTRDEPPPSQEPPQPAEPAEPSEPRGPRTVQGFRIQVLTTRDKATADQRVAALESDYPGQSVEVAWQAPYYRVRLGAFASRSDAQSLLSSVKEQYADAFLVPGTVTLNPD